VKHQINRKVIKVTDEIEQFAKTTAMQSLNGSSQSVGKSPIRKKRLDEGKQSENNS
jgi:hypothetical protein